MVSEEHRVADRVSEEHRLATKACLQASLGMVQGRVGATEEV